MEKRIIWYTLFLALVTGMALSFSAAPANWAGGELGFRFLLVASAITTVLHFGAAILFSSSLEAYKSQLRAAYICIALGVVCIALGTLQLPILSWFNLWDSAWVQKGGVTAPFLIAGVGLYAGARLFGRLVHAKTILTRAVVVLFGIVLLTFLVSLLPHTASPVPELEFDLANAVVLLDAFLMGASALIVLRIKNQIGEHYINAMAWLFTALVSGTVILLLAVIDSFLTNSDQDVTNQIITFLAAAAGLIWLRAGYAFAKAKDY